MAAGKLMKKIQPRKILRQRRRRLVALLIDSSRAYGRGLLLGVAKFLREHHTWSVQTEERRWTDVISDLAQALERRRHHCLGGRVKAGGHHPATERAGRGCAWVRHRL